MANGWGGNRPGAGRPRGMMSRRIRLDNPTLPMVATIAHRAAVQMMPIDGLLQPTRNEALPIDLRLAAAKAAAPYFHARVSVGPPKATFEMTEMELEQLHRRRRISLQDQCSRLHAAHIGTLADRVDLLAITLCPEQFAEQRADVQPGQKPLAHLNNLMGEALALPTGCAGLLLNLLRPALPLRFEQSQPLGTLFVTRFRHQLAPR